MLGTGTHGGNWTHTPGAGEPESIACMAGIEKGLTDVCSLLLWWLFHRRDYCNYLLPICRKGLMWNTSVNKKCGISTLLKLLSYYSSLLAKLKRNHKSFMTAEVCCFFVFFFFQCLQILFLSLLLRVIFDWGSNAPERNSPLQPIPFTGFFF